MRGESLRWEGTATALSSVVHGAQALGTVTYLRRERFLMPSGHVEEVPVVSGNAWRGLLRDVAADLWWERVGSPRLTLPVMHALWSGGALAKATGPSLTGARLFQLRQLCPVVGIFGAAGGGRIIDGCLQVGKLIPICQETAHIVPARYHLPTMPSLWDITQVEYYSRLPDTRAAVTGESEEEGSPLRFGVETFLAGTQFHAWLTLTWPTLEETAFFQEVLASFTREARVGGMGRAGHGRLALHLEPPTGLQTDSPWALPIDAASDAAPQRSTLLEVLAWLD